jgi:hypothetical protein
MGGAMQKLTICAVSCLVIALAPCGPTEESVSAVENGPFKILVRSREFHHSGTRIVDICVAQTLSRNFPKAQLQCFFRGFDFDGLAVKWRGSHEIEVSFQCGRVTYFTNNALVYPNGPVPEEFHATLRENYGYTVSVTCQVN